MKYLFNITIVIDKEIHQEWADWVLAELVLKIKNSVGFESSKLYRLLSESPNEGITYSLQFFSDKIIVIDDFRKKHEQQILNHYRSTYSDKFLFFSTVLKNQTE